MTETTDKPQNLAPAGSTGRSAQVNHRVDGPLRGLWVSYLAGERLSAPAVLICSADRREGASAIAGGLAVAGSEAGAGGRIALVDLNLRQPQVAKAFGADRGPGVRELLTASADLDRCVTAASDNLDVIGPGQASGEPATFFQDQAVRQLIETLSKRYARILLDVAAVNIYPDAQVLASAVPNAILVARSDQTPRESVAQARKTLETAGASVLGLVLNARTYPLPKFLYRRL